MSAPRSSRGELFWGVLSGRSFLRASLGLAVALSVVPLAGCGFKPLYGKADKSSVSVSRELMRVYVANMGGGRFGQVLRLGLQKEMAGAGPERPDGYVLKAWGKVSFEYIDIHQDNTSGRIRLMGIGNWRLYTVGLHPKMLAEGNVTTLDGFDPTLNQPFAQTLNAESGTERMAETMAHEITQQVAIWFRAHIAPGKINSLKPEMYLNGDTSSAGPAQSQPLGIDGFPAAATGRVSGSGSRDTMGAMPDLNMPPPPDVTKADEASAAAPNGGGGGEGSAPAGNVPGGKTPSASAEDAPGMAGAYNAGADGLPTGAAGE